MFYSHTMLCRGGQFYIEWIAATRGINKLKPNQINSVNISISCENIITMMNTKSRYPKDCLSLKLCTFLLSGLIRIRNAQVTRLYVDLKHFSITIMKPNLFDTYEAVSTSPKPTKKPQANTLRAQKEASPDEVDDVQDFASTRQFVDNNITMNEPDLPIVETYQPDIPFEEDIHLIEEIFANDDTKITADQKRDRAASEESISKIPKQFEAQDVSDARPEELFEMAPPPPVSRHLPLKTASKVSRIVRGPPRLSLKLPKKTVAMKRLEECVNLKRLKTHNHVRSKSHYLVINEFKKMSFDFVPTYKVLKNIDIVIAVFLSDTASRILESPTNLEKDKSMSLLRTPQTSAIQRPSSIQSSPNELPMVFEPEIISTPLAKTNNLEVLVDDLLVPMDDDSVPGSAMEPRNSQDEFGVTRVSRLRKLLVELLQMWSSGMSVTLEDVASKPLTKYGIAAAFDLILEAAKLEYVVLRNAEDGVLCLIEIGPNLQGNRH